MILDKNDIELTNGSIIDLHQTVNGENIFIVLDVKELDVRYRRDISYKYEYDTKELFAPGKFHGEVEFEIIGNISDAISPSNKELKDCVQNLMGVFDTPIARRKLQSEFIDEVRKNGREILEKIATK